MNLRLSLPISPNGIGQLSRSDASYQRAVNSFAYHNSNVKCVLVRLRPQYAMHTRFWFGDMPPDAKVVFNTVEFIPEEAARKHPNLGRELHGSDEELA